MWEMHKDNAGAKDKQHVPNTNEVDLNQKKQTKFPPNVREISGTGKEGSNTQTTQVDFGAIIVVDDMIKWLMAKYVDAVVF